MTVRGIPAIYYGTEHYAANFTSNSFGQVGSDPTTERKCQDLIRKVRLSPLLKHWVT
jgi:hypothetical protein